MLVHRILDAFFRTLDAVDAVRDRVDRALGREPRPDPWAVEWPPPAGPASSDPRPSDSEPAAEAAGTASSSSSAPDASPAEGDGAAAAQDHADQAPGRKARAQRDSTKKTSTKKTSTKKTSTKKTSAKKTSAKKDSTKKTDARKATGTRKAPGTRSAASRKGSVDRQGKDFDSPRARAVSEFIRETGFGLVTADAEHNGKKVLARVLWALLAAEAAGSEKGLTCADASALLHLSADIEVFATNLARACRDHPLLIAETEPDGRSKRYKLTEEGRGAAEALIAG